MIEDTSDDESITTIDDPTEVSSISVGTSSGTTYLSGGMLSSPGYVFPATATTRGGMLYPTESPNKRRKTVPLPSRFTEKILLAFIDENDPDNDTNVLWAAHLKPEFIEMTSEHGETFLKLTLSLEDVYGTDNKD